MQGEDLEKRLKTFPDVESYVAALEGKRPIKRLLVANNGIAAAKLTHSIRRWCYSTFGNERMIEIVAMASADDLAANMEYIRSADKVVHVPGGSNVNNYANVPLIVATAQQYECDAVAVGWGHASERQELPTMLKNAGITFVGPPAAPMFALGDKIGSTIIAQSAKVPTIAWNGDGLTVDYAKLGEVPDEIYQKANIRTVEEASKEIERMGLPVMIKASEGGGGKGIRIVDDMGKVEAAFRQVQSELPGSPIFIMRLSSASRHLEVQLLADEYGQAIALSGRDCSIQRRHQKILEEGPAVAARPDVWNEMEQAAIRLAKEVGYVNAGTVEYLYDHNDNFFFLELNPRLQVEHPVTEMITGVNVPACQLQVAMGIPLHRIPDVRSFYGCDDLYDSAKIDFDGKYASPPTVECRTLGHTIAARITAENPMAGFQPTSGRIHEINFRSSRNVWGYFSVDSSGKVHEFADSQIGHVFAWGESREEARRNLAMALNNLSIRGEIRTTIEYLKDLIEVDDYRNNKFDTTWLDQRIKSNIQVSRIDPLVVVLVGAACMGFKNIKGRTAEYLSMLERGQLPPPSLLNQSHAFELIYDDVKYSFTTFRTGEITLRLECNNCSVDVELRELADGGFLVLMGGNSHVAYTKDDVGAQRYIIDGQTCLFPDEYDPTQMRALMGGKLVRYLVEDGATVKKGEVYAEIEVMKMNMSLSALEDGVIHLKKPAGSVMEPGDVLCTMELADPSKVRRAELFTKPLPAFGEPLPEALDNMPHHKLSRARTKLNNVMLGFKVPTDTTERALAELEMALENPMLAVNEIESLLSVTRNTLPDKFVEDIESKCKAFRVNATLEGVEAFANSVALAASAEASVPAAAELKALAELFTSGIPAFHVDILGGLAESYVSIERRFAELEMSDAADKDDVLQELRAQNLGDLASVLAMSLANLSREPRDTLVLHILDGLDRAMRENKDNMLLRKRCADIIHDIASLNRMLCADVALEARQCLIGIDHSYEVEQSQVVDKLKASIAGDDTGRQELITSTDPVLMYLIDVSADATKYDSQVRLKALHTYIERVYTSFKVTAINSLNIGENDTTGVQFSFHSETTNKLDVRPGGLLSSVSSFEDLTSVLAPGSSVKLSDMGTLSEHSSVDGEDLASGPQRVPEAKARSESIEIASNAVAPFVDRDGLVVSFKTLQDMENQFVEYIKQLTTSEEGPLNVLHVLLTLPLDDEEEHAKLLGEFVAKHADALAAATVRRVTFSVAAERSSTHQQESIVGGHGCQFFTFRNSIKFAEDRLVRNIETPLAFQLDLQRLSNFGIRLKPVGKRTATSRSQTVHVYEATPKDRKPSADMKRYFVRALVRQAHRVKQEVQESDAFPGPERVFLQCIMALEAIQEEIGIPSARKNHIFLNLLSSLEEVNAIDVVGIIRSLHRRYAKRLTAQSVTEVEVRVVARLGDGAPSMPIRIVASNPTGFALSIESYVEASDANGDTIFYSIGENDGGLSSALAAMGLNSYGESTAESEDHVSLGSLHGKPVSTPYPTADPFDTKRARASAAGTTYCYDFPALFLKALEYEWHAHLTKIAPQTAAVPKRHLLVRAEELVLEEELDETAKPVSEGLCVTSRKPGTNTIGMVAWRIVLRTPQYPDGRTLILIANDITVKAGSFGTFEDALFERASKLARFEGLPRLYIAANSGARIGLAEEVKRAFKVKWINDQDPAKGFEYLYVDEEDFEQLGPDGRKSLVAEKVEDGKYRINAIVGESPDLGVENLRGSGTIAGETTRAYEESFTLSYVSGRTVGIGAYLVRLGQRVIQKGSDAPILLTGYQALNSLVGRPVYSSNLQLGGTKVMFANGVSHFSVRHDLEGVSRMINWLSYVPERRGAPLPLTTLSVNDAPDRDVEVHPSKLPSDFDPRVLLTGTNDENGKWLSGLFDRDSFTEAQKGWAKSVVIGRARLGKVPVGVIMPEIRTMEARTPADPAMPDSQEQVWSQAGQVFFPDSSYKTAQAIEDFNREGLPLMIVSNWRGFSGGTRDMANEVLKFGAMIVDALVGFKQPVFVYIPPQGQLRGGAWVVVDPTINPDVMEMYADEDARGGVLEAPGCVSVKFRSKDVIATAHRLDEKLISLDTKLAATSSAEEKASIRAEISEREKLIQPIFHQLAVQFADLHDRPGRMKAKGVIRRVVPWVEARRVFSLRLKRRLAEMEVCKKIESSLFGTDAANSKSVDLLEELYLSSSAQADFEDDALVLAWLESNEGTHAVENFLQTTRANSIAKEVISMGQHDSKAILSGLMGLIKNLQDSGRTTERESLVEILRKGVFLLSSDANANANTNA